jgi:hypothetical protein
MKCVTNAQRRESAATKAWIEPHFNAAPRNARSIPISFPSLWLLNYWIAFDWNNEA